MKQILYAVSDYIRRLDKILVAMCVTACGFSVLLLYSMYANQVSSEVSRSHFLTQIVASLLGLFVALVVAKIDYHFISKLWFLYAPAALITTLLLFTPLGITVDGADDIGWLDIGFMTFQPSEVLKVAFILTFSLHISKIGTEKLNKIRYLIPVLIHGMLPTLLIMKTGDDGSALVFFFIFIFILFAGGLSWKYIVAAIAIVPPAVYILWSYIMQPHQKVRIEIIFDMAVREAQPDLFYQQRLGLIALGSGKLTGTGLFGGEYTYVPKMHTDFIFAYIGNALGFIGCSLTVILLAAICLKILSVSSIAKDPLGKLICVGVFAMITFHCIINIGMVMVVMPVIGIPLPFISAGGTSAVSTFAAIGLVLSVYSYKDKQKMMFTNDK